MLRFVGPGDLEDPVFVRREAMDNIFVRYTNIWDLQT
jgi:hypothetical protein